MYLVKCPRCGQKALLRRYIGDLYTWKLCAACGFEETKDKRIRKSKKAPCLCEYVGEEKVDSNS